MEPLITSVVLITAVLAVIYLYIKQKYSYWKDRGVPFIEPSFGFGNIKKLSEGVHQAVLMKEFYERTKGKAPFCGTYFFVSPTALITDLDLVRNVLIRDFSYFHDRGMYFNERDDPLSAHMFSLEGQKWKLLRNKLSPTFTSGKMKFMFPTIVEVGERLTEHLQDSGKIGTEFDIKELMARFTTDIIGTCAFGIECNSLADPNTKFREMGKKAFYMESPLKPMFLMAFRRLSQLLHLTWFSADVSEFFTRIVKDTIRYREDTNSQRNDFMNLLMQLKNKGKLDGEADGTILGTLTLNEVAAQALLFFLAGFETSSTVLTYCIYELALNQDLQEKTRRAVEDVLQKHGGKITYEAVMDMGYLDQVINETLRKYPPVGNHFREASKDYAVPGTKFIIEKGTRVWIPAYAIHHDPEIYPNPSEFNPDRFHPDNVKQRHPASFLPFGDGPRNCIGLRFGLMQTRVGLISLLRNFKVTTCPKTEVPIEFESNGVVLCPKNGVWLNVKTI